MQRDGLAKAGSGRASSLHSQGEAKGAAQNRAQKAGAGGR